MVGTHSKAVGIPAGMKFINLDNGHGFNYTSDRTANLALARLAWLGRSRLARVGWLADLGGQALTITDRYSLERVRLFVVPGRNVSYPLRCHHRTLLSALCPWLTCPSDEVDPSAVPR